MAEEKPNQPKPEEESKKDTVRINLPPGITGRGPGPSTPTATPQFKPKPSAPPASPEDEAKKETAVMGRPAETPKPKKDTSRVQVSAAKPSVPETPRPTVKLRREAETLAEAPPAGPAVAAAKPGPVAPPSGADSFFAVGAMILSVAVLVYLAVLAIG